ncbi:unnamed protein product [Victoria cruziana]
MAELALPACTSPVFVSDRGVGELGRNGSYLRARIVRSGVLRKENHWDLGFSVNCCDSRKTDPEHGGIRVCKSKFGAIEYLRLDDWGGTAEVWVRRHGHGRSVTRSRCLCSGNGTSAVEPEKLGRFKALGSKNAHCTYGRIPAFGRFEREDSGTGFDLAPEAGSTPKNSSAFSGMNRRKYDDGITESEPFDQKFKEGGNNSEKFDSPFIDQESLGSSVDQLKKRKNSINKKTSIDEDYLLPIDRDMLRLRREMEQDGNLVRNSEPSNHVGGESTTGTQLEDEEMESFVNPGLQVAKQVLRRSNILAKQVISIQSALSLGFVSQLWVDAKSWMVLVVEVRPNLLSGEMDRFLLKDIAQVGDVVLVQDESVIENDLRLVGLETLVGYNVITESRRTVGKVRGYTFNINSGCIESLELDSFGVSIIPASLVSTYCLFVEDVLEVVSDTIVVEDGAASRIQRLSKGFWGNPKMKARDRADDYELDIRLAQRQRRSRNRSRARRFPSREGGIEYWDFPLDF